MNTERLWKFVKYVLMFAGIFVLTFALILLANGMADTNWGLHR